MIDVVRGMTLVTTLLVLDLAGQSVTVSGQAVMVIRCVV